MSDASQGPGWWQASDGKWYAPQAGAQPAPPPPPAAPLGAKGAKAAAKASKAHAKSLRPWYKKKRFIFSGVIVILIIVIVSSGSGKTPTRAGPAPTSGGTSAPAGCTAKPTPYPDQQTTDCVALPNNTVAIANTVVTATWARSADSLGQGAICAAVSIKNNNSSTVSYNSLDWKLQTPSGKVVDTNFTASNDLGSGDLVGGGTATGNVCFDDPAQSGTYIGIYKPDPFSATRGIWLFPLT